MFRFSWSTWSAVWTEEPGCWKQCPRWAYTFRWWRPWTASRSPTRCPCLPPWCLDAWPGFTWKQTKEKKKEHVDIQFVLHWEKKGHFLLLRPETSDALSSYTSFCRLLLLFPDIDITNAASKQWSGVAAATCSARSPSSALTLIHLWECPNPPASLLFVWQNVILVAARRPWLCCSLTVERNMSLSSLQCWLLPLSFALRALNTSQLQALGIDMMPHYKDPYSGRVLTRGEIGCFLSHHSIWTQVKGFIWT